MEMSLKYLFGDILWHRKQLIIHMKGFFFLLIFNYSIHEKAKRKH